MRCIFVFIPKGTCVASQDEWYGFSIHALGSVWLVSEESGL